MRLNRRVASIFLFAILFLLVRKGIAQNQEASHDSRFSIQANVGYTSYRLDDVKDFYDEILMVYTEGGIAMPTQNKYEPNWIAGLAVLYKTPTIIDFGLGSQYSKATALSSYADFAGSIEVKSNVSFLSLEGIVQHDFPSRSNYNFYASLRGGLAFIHSSYTHDIVFNDFPDQSGFIDLSGSGTGYTAEGMIGIKRSFMNFDIRITAGYRQTSVKKIKATLEATGENTLHDTIHITHDLSGLALNALIAYNF
jgi:hypothetical protein